MNYNKKCQFLTIRNLVLFVIYSYIKWRNYFIKYIIKTKLKSIKNGQEKIKWKVSWYLILMGLLLASFYCLFSLLSINIKNFRICNCPPRKQPCHHSKNLDRKNVAEIIEALSYDPGKAIYYYYFCIFSLIYFKTTIMIVSQSSYLSASPRV